MTEADYMLIALKEAKRARDNNGAVGAVIVLDDKIISQAGSDVVTGRHAEDNAILASGWQDTTITRKGSIMYVTYQPCIKRSKTGFVSCTDLIKNVGIGEVVFGVPDPNFNTEEVEKIYQRHGIELKQVDDIQIRSLCQKTFDDSFLKGI